ncbi:unnamed protein product [Orchesella dallaii]|uniref:ZAD domain-containing protein n=1 Tax=Orchesella dallaii TaxID=48710 RepID=A0ABP1PTU4_9HEXA
MQRPVRPQCQLPAELSFNCRICNGIEKGYFFEQLDISGKRANLLKTFCGILDFTQKEVPRNCPRSQTYFCISCERDINDIVNMKYEKGENLQKKLRQLFAKVTVITLPPGEAPGAKAEPDWLTYLTRWMLKCKKAARMEMDMDENSN